LLRRSIDRDRSDDHPEILQRRLDLFHERTIPLLEYYDYRNKLLTVNGDQSPEQVQQDLLKLIEAKGK
jgi:adenylate kinase